MSELKITLYFFIHINHVLKILDNFTFFAAFIINQINLKVSLAVIKLSTKTELY